MSDRSRTGVLIPITNGYVKRTCENDLALPSTQRLENAGPGAAAHMSLHLELTMSKSAKDRRLGLPSFGERPLRRDFDDRNRRTGWPVAAVAVIYAGRVGSSTSFLHFYFESAQKRRKSAVYAT